MSSVANRKGNKNSNPTFLAYFHTECTHNNKRTPWRIHMSRNKICPICAQNQHTSKYLELIPVLVEILFDWDLFYCSVKHFVNIF